MKKVPFILVLIMMTASLAGCLRGDADSNDDSDDTVEPTWLATQTATNATSNNGTLILETQEDIFVFSDRPDRLWNYVEMLKFQALWTPNSTFDEDPPNAVLTWKSDNGSMAFAEIILTDARWNNATGFVEYDYTFETGDTLLSNISDVSLFIDGWFGSCGGKEQAACTFPTNKHICDDGFYFHNHGGPYFQLCIPCSYADTTDGFTGTVGRPDGGTKNGRTTDGEIDWFNANCPSILADTDWGDSSPWEWNGNEYVKK